MTARKSLAAALLTTTAVLAPASTAFAAAPTACDAYSHKCTHVEGTKIVKTPSSDGPSALPFTGAEIVLLTVVGVGALGAGTMFVVAGRRRRGVETA